MSSEAKPSARSKVRRSSFSQEQEALISLFKAAGRVRRRFRGTLEFDGLTESQYNVLRILRGARGPLPIMTIRDRMMDPEPSITRLVDKLEKRGLVQRNRCTDDRRRIDCCLTAEGLDLVNSLDKPVDLMDREVMGGFTKAELRSMIDLLGRVGVQHHP